MEMVFMERHNCLIFIHFYWNIYNVLLFTMLCQYPSGFISLCLKNTFQGFLYCKSARAKFSQFFFVRKYLCCSFTFEECVLWGLHSVSTVIFSVYFEAISSVSSVVSVQKSPAVYSDPVRLISFCPCCSCKILFYFIFLFSTF